MTTGKIVFASYAESTEQLKNCCTLTESLRTFGGRFKNAPVWVMVPQDAAVDSPALRSRLETLHIELKSSRTPEEAKWLFYSGKVAAAAQAEAEAEGQFGLLAWLDEDTVVLEEPSDFDLSPEIDLAYVPVMHNRSGSLYDEPADPFWAVIYERLGVTDQMLFPMVTPADNQKIRAYPHCGLLVVRPQQKLLRRWAEDFERLYTDPLLCDMCREDRTKRVFLHQTALTGLLHLVPQGRMLDLLPRYNYPVFFERRYGATQPFTSLDNIVTTRWVVSLKDIGPDWDQQLSGPAEKIAWLKDHLS